MMASSASSQDSQRGPRRRRDRCTASRSHDRLQADDPDYSADETHDASALTSPNPPPVTEPPQPPSNEPSVTASTPPIPPPHILPHPSTSPFLARIWHYDLRAHAPRPQPFAHSTFPNSGRPPHITFHLPHPHTSPLPSSLPHG